MKTKCWHISTPIIILLVIIINAMFIQEEGGKEGYHEKGRERELKSTMSCCLSEQQQFIYNSSSSSGHTTHYYTLIRRFYILIIYGSVEWIGLTLRSCPDGEWRRIYQYVIDIQMLGQVWVIEGSRTRRWRRRRWHSKIFVNRKVTWMDSRLHILFVKLCEKCLPVIKL